MTYEIKKLWFSVASIGGVSIRGAIAIFPPPEPSDRYILSCMEQVEVQSRVNWIMNGNALLPAKKAKSPSFGSAAKRSHFHHIQLKSQRSPAQVILKKLV
jgi:hypothetical protein